MVAEAAVAALEGLDPIVQALFVLSLGQNQVFGLFFLLGTFAVATLSDLRHMAAQREFFHVWLVFVGAMAVLDAHQAYQAISAEGTSAALFPLLKWGLLGVLSLLSWSGAGVLFKLARADVSAMAAAGALLTPGLIVVFWVLLKVFDLAERPLLRRGAGEYPFMPVVTSATLAILALGFYLGWVAGM